MPLARLFLLFALMLVTPCRADVPTFTILHMFSTAGRDNLTPSHDINPDGAHPLPPPIQGHDGAFYGTTVSGGAHGTGVIFKINADGTGYAVLHSFGPIGTLSGNDTNADGCHPMAALVYGKDGTLYGAAMLGGHGGGTIFKLDPDGTGFTVLHSFDSKEELFHNNGGASPFGLTLGPDAALYGAAGLGGYGRGLLFRLTTDGKNFRVIHSFDDVDHDDSANNGGATPSTAVVFGRDGLLYGTTNIGGRNGGGVLYRMGSDGKHFAVLHNFGRKTRDNGAFPNGTLIFSADGILFGTTRMGGVDDGGIAYKMNVDGTGFAVLYAFSDSLTESDDGWGPSGLVLGRDGNLYGLSGSGRANVSAVLFKINASKTKCFLLHNFSAEEGTGNDAGLTLGSDGNLYGVSTNRGANDSGTIFRIVLHPAQ